MKYYICHRPSKVQRFRWIINEWSQREQWILIPENLTVSRDEVELNIEIRGKQNSLFPSGPVIK